MSQQPSSHMHIILASASIGRRGLLEKLGVPFEVVVSTIDEEAIIDNDPVKMIEKRALAKAENVVEQLTNNQITQFSNSQIHSQKNTSLLPAGKLGFPLSAYTYLVIAADSMAVVGNPPSPKTPKGTAKAYGKVKDNIETVQMIRDLMGKKHDFVTATSVRLIQNNTVTKKWDTSTTSTVALKNMTDEEITLYTKLYDFTRFAACYTLNDTPWDWVTKIDGSYTSVIGLPFEVVLPIFRELKII